MKLTDDQPPLQSIRQAGLIFKPDSPDLKDTYLDIIKTFESRNINVQVEKNSAMLIQKNGVDFDQLCLESDFLVSIGGDGTLISVTRRSFQYNKPVLGINLGNLGFLTDIMPNEIGSFLKKMENKEYRIDTRMMLELTVDSKTYVSFNDIVITRSKLEDMATIDAKIDGKLFNSYHGDGLIVSTPTGSTAYNLSSGGPVVYPLTDAIIVTPISAHSLTQRPLVLPKDFEIELSSATCKDLVIIIDGQDRIDINKKHTIKIKNASKKAQLIHRCERNYFDVLNKKLHWGQNS
ncbi:MAG: NAD(+) kinase [Campylobacteraceae bacterium]|jgi:NAD+ kinase|nr:NAD(+) kinase [Campylobacteraceae bacterium]MBT3882868.1 NAD(+) kinase [Campylobacteraceae bacterium]MBT4030294.1 NAD(+) kinase [Campylobacteraceae bacterium]MBT4179636.1 NAD(+) kinase [Campylobacteraceae bacterium]MBT4572973.1 NAD(+) kinase [Campylobacteraceae bacterium]